MRQLIYAFSIAFVRSSAYGETDVYVTVNVELDAEVVRPPKSPNAK